MRRISQKTMPHSSVGVGSVVCREEYLRRAIDMAVEITPAVLIVVKCRRPAIGDLGG